jgi:hypothetical protein
MIYRLTLDMGHNGAHGPFRTRIDSNGDPI